MGAVSAGRGEGLSNAEVSELVDLLGLAREAGVRISIGSDAHASTQLEFVEFGIAAARRAGIPDEQIINCMTADQLLAWTDSLGRRLGS